MVVEGSIVNYNRGSKAGYNLQHKNQIELNQVGLTALTLIPEKLQTRIENIAPRFAIEVEKIHSQRLETISTNIEKLDQAISMLENCKYCSVMLLNLINDMMDLAKTEQMKFELNNEFFDVTKTVERAFDTLSYFGE